ncbi:MAG: hypothetical protein IJS36_00440 [Kiritimatiellae bacterium]|nr:hypothetical protein [Kiritimatiellia bacterium]
METEDRPTLDLGAIDFTPDWAKRDAGVSVGHVKPERETPERGAVRDGARKQFGDKRGPGDRKPFGDRNGAGRRLQSGGAGRKPFQPAERPKPLDAEIKILPETKALGTIIRKLQQDFHAYKLKDLAYFFLDNPGSVLLKITPRAAEGAAHQPFHQCKACGFATTSDDELVQHLVSAHLGDYYDVKEVDREPPKGNFSCVAKCGLSGVLLGPPNIHEFNATVREMIRTRYPNMSEEQYRAHIEMVRDPESIEEWRKGAVKKTVFTAKGAGEGAPELTREQAEAEFRRSMMPSLVDAPKSLMITADVALKSPVKPLVWAVRDALEAERRAPYNMCFALRGAFHHRKLKFFRANDARGPEFVTSADLKEFDAAHAIPELAKLATYIADHPCSPRVDLVTDKETEKHLVWLVSTGHVVAFTNGVYSAVEKFPKYGPQWQKRKSAPAPAAPVDTASAAQESAAQEEKKEEPKDETPAQLA